MGYRSIVCGAVLAACAAGPAFAAGSAEVNFTRPERFADAGDTPSERDANLRLLAEQLKALAARNLPADQSLQIDVLDVDLAGRTRPTQRGSVRITRDDRDSASITLHYTLLSNGQTLRSGDASLSDLTTRKALAVRDETAPLQREKALLSQWFTKEFAAPRAAVN